MVKKLTLDNDDVAANDVNDDAPSNLFRMMDDKTLSSNEIDSKIELFFQLSSVSSVFLDNLEEIAIKT